jgi:hypothetical protein
MPNVIGYVGDKIHDDIIKGVEELELFYRGQMATLMRNVVRYWRLYFADRDDKRLPHEKKWRANTFVPHPYITLETKIAALSEILLSTDPWVQAEGIGPEDEGPARKMEHIHGYSLRKNNFPFQLDMTFREMGVQGLTFWKLVWANRSRRVPVRPDATSVQTFHKAVEMAVQLGAGNPPEDPAQFEEWRQTVNTARLYGSVPELPIPGNKEIVEYRGPGIERVFLGDTRFDPMIETVQEQDLFIHRVVKKKKWLLDRTGDEPNKKFDPRQVQAGLSGLEDRRFSEWEEQIAAWMGIPRTQEDPTYQDAVELWECWRQGTDAPYCVILNRKAIINKTPDTLPFWHGMTPFVPLRNVPMSRRLPGISDYQQTERLYGEINSLHDILLDAVVLAVLPAFVKARGSGIIETQQTIRPAGFIEADNAQAITPLTKFDPGLQWGFKQISELRNLVDQTTATGPNVQGQSSTIGRVSATESQGRLSQALVRQKQHALRIEEEMSIVPKQFAFLWYQFGDPEIRLRIGGDDVKVDPFVSMRRENLLEVLDIDFRFRGATKALNRELSAQMLDGWLKTGTGAQALLPWEIRAVLRKIYEIQGHKGADLIITAQGSEDLEKIHQAKMAQVDQQLLMAKQQAMAAQLGQTPTPNEIPLPEGQPAAEAAPAA